MLNSIIYPMINILAQSKDKGSSSGGISMFVMLGGMLVLMYLFIFRPQSKQKKEHQNMLTALKKGDKVVTIGGIVGIITNVKDDNTVVLKIADNVKVDMRRSGIAQILTPKEEKEENPVN